VSTWRDVALSVLQAPGVLDRLQIPFAAGPMADRYFVNEKPIHSDGRSMRDSGRLDVGGRTLYIELNYSTISLIQILGRVLRAVGVEPDACILLKKPEETAQD